MTEKQYNEVQVDQDDDVRTTSSSRSRSSRRYGRERRKISNVPEGGSRESEGPHMVTMLFIAVALATVFNLSKSGRPDPSTVVYKSDPGIVKYKQGGLRSTQFDSNSLQNGLTNNQMLLNTMPFVGQTKQISPQQLSPEQMLQQQMLLQQQLFQMQMAQQNMQSQQSGMQQPGTGMSFLPQNQFMNQQVQNTLNSMGDQQGSTENLLPQQQLEQPQKIPDSPLQSGTTPVEEVPDAQQQLQPSQPADVQQQPQPADNIQQQPQPADVQQQPQPSDVQQQPQPSDVQQNNVNYELNGFKDSWDPHEGTDQPVFWHIPKAGGSTIKNIMGRCHRFIQVSESGITEGHDQDKELAVVRPQLQSSENKDPSAFINVDTTTIQGIERAKALKLAESNLADFITSSYIFELEQIFIPTARGRLFSMFRDPVERVTSLFYYLQVADWEPTYNPELAKMTLSEFATSNLSTDNWMVRHLSGRYGGDVNENQLNIAMDIIRRKFLVGLLKEAEKSLERFEKFFGWKYKVNPENQEKCREKLLSEGANLNSNMKKEKPEPGDPVYELIAGKNLLDIELYKYIESLFVEQEQFVADKTNGFRLQDATCAKCVPPAFPSSGNVAVQAIDQSYIAPLTVTIDDYSGFADTDVPFDETDTPVFWHIPKAGGSTIKDIMGTCHRFTQASEAGIAEGHDQDTELAVVRPGGVPVDQDPSPFINVDPTTLHGIERAKKLGLAESNKADFIVSPYVQELDKVFSPQARGRIFTVFRHPVDRATSMFFYIQIADWEPTYNPELAKMSLAEYAVSPNIENNWMVRTLTLGYAGEIGEEHLNLAKDIIGKKFLVGLLSEKMETMERAEKFFHWKFRVNPDNQNKCREKLLTGGANSNAANKKEKPKPGDEAYELIAAQNVFDIKLYEFIEELFKKQAAIFENIPHGYRMVDSSCAKCVPPTFPSNLT